MMFGVIAGVIFSQISSMRIAQESYSKRHTELKKFASAHGLTKPLRLRLLAFHRFLYEGGTAFDEKAILSELPLHMQRDVVCECDRTSSSLQMSLHFVRVLKPFVCCHVARRCDLR